MRKLKTKLPPIEDLGKIDEKHQWSLGQLVMEYLCKQLVEQSEEHTGKLYNRELRRELQRRLCRGSDTIDEGLDEALSSSAKKEDIRLVSYQKIPLRLQSGIDWSDPQMRFETSSKGRPVEVIIHMLRVD